MELPVSYGLDQWDTLHVLLYLFVINALTWFAFWYDKRQAIQQGWRISESKLLFLCIIGGTLSAYTARRHYRHKTRKQPFTGALHLIAVAQIVLCYLALYTWLTENLV